MRKSIILIFLFVSFFFLNSTFCRAKEVTFTIENSPYCIQRSLVIKQNDTFTAEPGVVIEMGKNASIVVDGKIDISGYPKGGEVIFKAAKIGRAHV